MQPGMIYPNVTDAVRGVDQAKQPDLYKKKVEEALKARALADLATSTRGTHRQKVIDYFFEHPSIGEAAELWGDRGQRRAAARARSLRARGYKAVP